MCLRQVYLPYRFSSLHIGDKVLRSNAELKSGLKLRSKSNVGEKHVFYDFMLFNLSGLRRS